jgi:oligogalacturonide transporter
VSMRFRLNPRTHAILQQEIERFRKDPAAPPTSAESARIVEDLSGWRYAQLWGKNDVLRKEVRP